MLHASGSGSVAGAGSESAADSVLGLSTGVVFVLVQVLCSVIAGVYNEYIIKGRESFSYFQFSDISR
jgi:hypothetical protein